MSAREIQRATVESLAAIAACRAILAPGFGRYWDNLTRQDRLFFLDGAGIGRRKEIAWHSLSAEEQAKARDAWAQFMSGDPRPVPVPAAS